MKPFLIKGNTFNDHRGKLNFINEFDFPDVVRFYQINNAGIDVIRAWQGHQVEKKYFYASAGAFVIAWVEIDDFKNPSENLKAEYSFLRFSEPSILCIPGGYANGIKALEENSSLIIFSNLPQQQSENDRTSYDSDLWFNWQSIQS